MADRPALTALAPPAGAPSEAASAGRDGMDYSPLPDVRYAPAQGQVAGSIVAADVAFAKMMRGPVSNVSPALKLFGVVLVAYGLLRLGVLVSDVASLPPGDLTSLRTGLILSVIEYGLIGAAPLITGIAILKRRRWARASGIALCAAGILLDLHSIYLGLIDSLDGVSPLPTSQWLGWLVWAGIVLQTAAAIALARNRDEFDMLRHLPLVVPDAQVVLPRAPFRRTAAVLLILSGLGQLLFPLASMIEQPFGSVWLAAEWVDLAGQGVSILDPGQLLLYLIAAGASAWSCGLGQATLAIGTGMLWQRRWARQVGTVVCAFGLWIYLRAIIGGALDDQALAFAVAYAFAFAVGLAVLSGFRVRSVEPGWSARRDRRRSDNIWALGLTIMMRGDGVIQPVGESIMARSSRVVMSVLLTAPVLAGFAGGVVATGASPYGRPDNTPNVAFLFVLGPAAVISLWSVSRHRMLRPANAIEELERWPDRRPILYLRPFALDKEMSARFPHLASQPMNSLGSAIVPEERIVRVLRKTGPVIAIGHVGDLAPDLGAARFWVRDDVWYRNVTGVARFSRLVVLVTGLTEGLRSEIEFLTKEIPFDKLILCPHPPLFGLRDDVAEDEWRRFRETLGTLFPQPLPERLGAIRLIHFTSAGKPLPVRRSTIFEFGGYAGATIAVMTAKAIPPWSPGARMRWRLIIALVLFLIGIAIAMRAEIWSFVTNLGVDRSIIPF